MAGNPGYQKPKTKMGILSDLYQENPRIVAKETGLRDQKGGKNILSIQSIPESIPYSNPGFQGIVSKVRNGADEIKFSNEI